MDEQPRDVDQRLTALERRVQDLEGRLNGGMAVVARPQAESEPAGERLLPLAESRRDISQPPAVAGFAAASSHGDVGLEAATERQAADRSGWSLERMIGGRFYAAIGAIVVVAGVGMFLKLAMDRGWLRFPPEMRCLAAGAFGFALLGLGEWARRRINAAAAAGLSAAGLAATYSAVLGAFGLYHLLTSAIAMALLTGVAILGIVVALRSRQLLMAMLAVGGALAAPAVVGASRMGVAVMPLYLSSVLAVGLWLSAAMPSPFRPVRSLAWWGTVVLGSIWAVDAAAGHALAVLAFAGAVWVAVHAELGVGAARAPELSGAIRGDADRRAVRPVYRSFASTAWTVVIGVFAARQARTGIVPPDWSSPAAAFVAAALGGMMLSGPLRAFRDPPETDAQRLGVGLIMQAGALLIATVALALSSWVEVVAWLSMGLAAAGAGCWMRSRSLALYGQAVLGIAVGRLLIYDSWHLPSGSAMIAGLVLTKWSVLMLAAAASYAVAGVLLRSPEPRSRMMPVSEACFGAAWSIGFAAFVNSSASGPPVGMVAVAACCGVLLHGYALSIRTEGGRRSGLFVFGVGCLLITGIEFVWIHLLRGCEDQLNWPPGLTVTGTSLPIAFMSVAWLLAGWLSRNLTGVPYLRALSAIPATACVMLVPHTMESSPVSLAVFWLSADCVLLAVQAMRPAGQAGWIALGVLAATALLWTVTFPLAGWIRTAPPSGLHPGFAIGMLLCAVLFIAAMVVTRCRHDRRRRFPAGAVVSWTLLGLVLFASTSLEVNRGGRLIMPHDAFSRAGVISLWWGVFAAGMLWIGFARVVPIVRHVGLGLLGVATLKAVIVDLADVASEWRVASFIGLGLLMLGVAVAYSKAGKRLAEEGS